MQVLRPENFPAELKGGAVSIGKFDGMHLGHALITHRLKGYANSLQIPSVIVTFEQPPVFVLKPEVDFRPICTLERKIELIQTYNIDALVILATNKELLQRTAEDFFQAIIKDAFDTGVIVEGRNFMFGCNREGDAEKMTLLGQDAGMKVDIVDSVKIGNERVSSSNIRQLLLDGKIEQVNELMPQPYRLTGTVIQGDRRGRTIGFPTANLGGIQTIIPKPGIYAAMVWLDGQPFIATTHIGTLPTFNNRELRVEVFLHHFDGDLYGKTVNVDLLAYLRKVIHFETVEELVQQMTLDVQRSEKICGK